MERFGPFDLQRRLGAGGMAEAFLARRSDGSGGLVCVKRILPGLKNTPGFATMFRDEIALTRSLHDTHIVATLDSGDEDGVLWLAMEYVDGPSLAEVLARVVRDGVRPTIGQALEIGRQLALALDAAHTAKAADGLPLGIVHRDVSPQNILLTRGGVLKLSDFGIARAEERLARTATGVMKGKLGYLAPEQITGDVVDHRADQFAAGIVLWEVLCTRRLFRGPDLEVLEAVVGTDVAPPSRFRDDVPPLVDALVARMLQRDPRARFPTMAAVVQALDSLLSTASSSERALVPLVMLADESTTMRIPRTRFTIEDSARLRPASAAATGVAPPVAPGDDATVEGDVVDDETSSSRGGPTGPATPFDDPSGTGARAWPAARPVHPGDPRRAAPPPRPPSPPPVQPAPAVPAPAPQAPSARFTGVLAAAAVAALTGAIGLGVGVWVGQRSATNAATPVAAPAPSGPGTVAVAGGSITAEPAAPVAPPPDAPAPSPDVPAAGASDDEAPPEPRQVDERRLASIERRWQALRKGGASASCVRLLEQLEATRGRAEFLVGAEPLIDRCAQVVEDRPRTASSGGRDSDDAKSLMLRGQYADAVKVLKAAVARNPADPRTHLQLGICYAQLRNASLAREHYRRFLELQPTGPDADRVRKTLESL